MYLARLWYPNRLWFGPSGEDVPPGRVVAAVGGAMARLESGSGAVDGWLVAVSLGDADVRQVSARIFEVIICAHTGASAASFELWTAKPGRRRDEVCELLALAVQFARTAGAGVAS